MIACSVGVEVTPWSRNPAFVNSALLSSGQYQHHQIHQFPRRWQVSFGQTPFDQNQDSVRGNDSSAVDQYLPGLFVVPIMNDTLHQVGSTAGGYFAEKIALLHGSAGRQLASQKPALPGAFQHVSLVCQDTSQHLVNSENMRQQDSVSTSYVHDTAPHPKIVRRGNSWTRKIRAVGHRIVKDACQ